MSGRSQSDVVDQPNEMTLLADSKANPKLNNFATSFRFTMETTRLTKTPAVTPSIELNGVMWSVQFKYKNHNLDIHLIPNFEKAASDSIQVEASFKLLQRIDRKDKTFAKFLTKRLINNAEELIMEKFVNWNEFKLNFEYEQKATIEIEIITNPLKRKDLKPPHGFDVMSKKSLIELDNMKAMDQNVTFEFDLRGVKWTAYTGKKDGSLAVYLGANENDLEKLSWNVHATFTLLSFNNNVDSVQHTFTHNYNVASPMRGVEKFLDWNDLLDPNKQFVVNDKANLFVEITLDETKQIWNL